MEYRNAKERYKKKFKKKETLKILGNKEKTKRQKTYKNPKEKVKMKGISIIIIKFT